MFTECLIKFIDDSEEEYAVIKDSDYDEDVDRDFDDLVFYYGIPKNELEELSKSGEAVDGEWVVVAVIGSFDKFESELYEQ